MTLTEARLAALTFIAAERAPLRRRSINRRKRDGGEGRSV